MKNLQLYNRFSVDQGFRGDNSTTWSDSHLYTQDYLQDRTVTKNIERFLGLLRSRVGLATLEQLCKHFVIFVRLSIIQLVHRLFWWRVCLSTAYAAS